MKKLFGALVVGTIVFGAVMASAAALNVNGGIIQVGTNSNSLSCDLDGVGVAWNTDQHGIVTSAQVSLSSADATRCDGQHLYLFALGSGGPIIGAMHVPSVDCGAPGDPLVYAPALIAGGATSYKLALGQTDDQLTNQAAMPCGVNGAAIYGVRVIIGV